MLTDKSTQQSSTLHPDDVAANPRKGSSSKKASVEAELLARLTQMEQKIDTVLELVYQTKKEVSHG